MLLHFGNRKLCLLLAALSVAFAGVGGPARAQTLADFVADIVPAELHPDADAIGPSRTDAPASPLLRGEEIVGWAYLNSELTDATGYSGKPIHVAVGLDRDGVISGAELVGHSEPIVLVGIPESRIVSFIESYVGTPAADYLSVAARNRLPADIVSGATVTIMVIDDAMKRSALKAARQLGLGGLSAAPVDAGAQRMIDMAAMADEDWPTLLGDGSVRRLSWTVADANAAFEASGNAEAAAKPEDGPPQDTFIDLYTALVTIPTIGRSLLGAAEYKNLTDRLEPGQHAILVAGLGRYSFKGSGYVRGGIFDRFQLIQGDISVRFRDRAHTRIGDLAAAGAPDFDEIGLFRIPADSGFDPAAPWRLQLLVQRQIGALERAFVSVDLGYQAPARYLIETAPAPTEAATVRPGAADELEGDIPLWQRIWESRVVDIAILIVALTVLTAIFFFQDWLVRRPRLTDGIRLGFLLFTVLWIGFYANAQISVVNVLTFANALLTGFRWEYFMADPMIFILWISVTVSLLFWGRGAYCGWLCPFGALQEILNKLAKWVRIPQFHVPWGLHERAWPLKYMIFLGLFGLSLHSLAEAERFSEVEPFKTAIILNFVREWPFVVYAGVLLFAGLFVERFFCRYLCPLGAALAIPGRMRMFRWLRRYRECGHPCQRCAQECMVQAIHPTGEINPNECLYCLHCQQLYYDDHKCPVMIQKRLKIERRLALQSPSTRSRDRVEADPA